MTVDEQRQKVREKISSIEFFIKHPEGYTVGGHLDDEEIDRLFNEVPEIWIEHPEQELPGPERTCSLISGAILADRINCKKDGYRRVFKGV